MRLIWDEAAWEQYFYWKQTDRALLRKINTLLKKCQRTPLPPPLKKLRLLLK